MVGRNPDRPTALYLLTGRNVDCTRSRAFYEEKSKCPIGTYAVFCRSVDAIQRQKPKCKRIHKYCECILRDSLVSCRIPSVIAAVIVAIGCCTRDSCTGGMMDAEIINISDIEVCVTVTLHEDTDDRRVWVNRQFFFNFFFPFRLSFLFFIRSCGWRFLHGGWSDPENDGDWPAFTV
ncbi:hypothetical protein F4679DRAFT_139189 [Xylaria curta]|nr:hypothetical protein F4679DRAFT_139189 [Xylaria curta]